MKISRVAVLCAMSLSIALPAFAADGAATFKAKCSICHGTEGQGKVGPSLKGISLSSDDIVNLLTKGDETKKMPHKKPLSGLSGEDVKAVADFVKTLK